MRLPRHFRVIHRWIPFLFAFFFTLFFSSCSPSESQTNSSEKYGMPEDFVIQGQAVPSSDSVSPTADFSITADASRLYKAVFPLRETYTDCALYGGILYFASDHGLVALDLASGAESSFADGTFFCVDANANGVYAVSADSFTQYSADGNALLTYPLSGIGKPVCGTVAGETYLFAADAGNGTEHELFALSIADGSVENVSDRFFAPNSQNTRLYVTDLQAVGESVWAVSLNQNE